jgi:N-acetylmuramoyl-L-alanine amidase
MEKIIIILDPAHGSDIPGKGSPDGQHKEYLWSREMCELLELELSRLGYKVCWTNPEDYEIGRLKRVEFANQVPGERKLMLSLHNNAAGKGDMWKEAHGFAAYTTKGQTKSDKCAEIILSQAEKDFPELMHRFDTVDGDKDKENNFTVLTGAGYWAVLLEWMFQDNKEDLSVIMSPDYKKRLIACLARSVEIIDQEVI